MMTAIVSGHGMRVGQFTVVLALVITSPSNAQRPTALKIVGDTGGALSGCSAKVAIDAISRWFAAYNTADSVALAQTMARPKFVFSTGKHWVAGDVHRRVDESLPALLAYVRERRQQGDSLALYALRVGPWRGARFGFIPYYMRTANDLGSRPISGWGKAEYWCNMGIRVLNLAPKPDYARSPSNEEL